MADDGLLEDVVADRLLVGVLRGDRAAWLQLTLMIEEWVERYVPRHWRMRKARLATSRDDVRDVLLAVIERIDRDDFSVLRQYFAYKTSAVPDVRTSREGPEQTVTFRGWLTGLVDFAIRDHVRKRYGRAPLEPPAGSAVVPRRSFSKRDLQSWAVHPSEPRSGDFGGQNPAFSRVLTARSILAYATEVFAPNELALLRRYLESASFEELAEEFELTDAASARAEVRRIKERLRARFRDA